MGLKKFIAIFLLIILNFIFLASLISETSQMAGNTDIKTLTFIQMGIFLAQLIMAFSILFSFRRMKFLRTSFLLFLIGFLNSVFISFNSVIFLNKANILYISMVNVLGIVICSLSMHWDNIFYGRPRQIREEAIITPVYVRKHTPKKVKRKKAKKAKKKRKKAKKKAKKPKKKTKKKAKKKAKKTKRKTR